MIFSSTIAGVDQSMRRSTRKPRLNQDANRWVKSSSTAVRSLRCRERVKELLAHVDQRGRAAGREVEAAEQLLAARLRCEMQFRDGFIALIALPGLDRGGKPLAVRAEALRKRLEHRDARAGLELGVAGQDVACERDTGRFAAAGQQVFAKLDDAFGLGCRPTAIAGAVEQCPAALGDRLQHFAEERGVHFPCPTAGPIR